MRTTIRKSFHIILQSQLLYFIMEDYWVPNFLLEMQTLGPAGVPRLGKATTMPDALAAGLRVVLEGYRLGSVLGVPDFVRCFPDLGFGF